MTLADFEKELNLKRLTQEVSGEVEGCYACDLLSWVMSHGSPKDAWITVMNNINVIAVAVLIEVGCVIMPEGITAAEDVIERANKEGVTIYSSEMSTYELCWRINKLLCV